MLYYNPNFHCLNGLKQIDIDIIVDKTFIAYKLSSWVIFLTGLGSVCWMFISFVLW